MKQQGKQPDAPFYANQRDVPEAENTNGNTNPDAIENSPSALAFIAQWRKQQGLD